MNWLKRLLRNDQLESELDRELQYHFDRQVDEHVRAGLSVEQARRAVRARFGGLDQVKEECRDARGTRWVADFLADLKYGARLAARDRSTTAFAIVALALGIGVNSTFFTVVNAVCLRGLPIDRADRVLDPLGRQVPGERVPGLVAVRVAVEQAVAEVRHEFLRMLSS